MIVVLSGEGPTDLGRCTNGQGQCSEPDFALGPMAVLLDKLMVPMLGYSLRDLTPDSFRFFSETALSERARQRKAQHRRLVLPGKKHDHETGYFYANAWDLGSAAREMELASGDATVAVLFRDSDPMRSHSAAVWDAKWKSMLDGFLRAGFERGIPMLPKPKSEAWLLSAAKDHPFQHCAALEDLSGNDDSPDSAKDKLAVALGGRKSAQELNEWLDDVVFDVDGASEMLSFSKFYGRLQEVMREIVRG